MHRAYNMSEIEDMIDNEREVDVTAVLGDLHRYRGALCSVFAVLMNDRWGSRGGEHLNEPHMVRDKNLLEWLQEEVLKVADDGGDCWNTLSDLREAEAEEGVRWF
tara:strand:- start:548 stop:862 length:315 start_codon:yes stop_codon:yes gene_type:complete